MKVKDLKRILEKVDDELDIAALDHYGDPVPYDKYDFVVQKTVFEIVAKDIGPEPD